MAAKISSEFGVEVCARTMSDYLARLGFVRLTVRPEHPKAKEDVQEAFKKNFAQSVASALPKHVSAEPLEV